MTSVDVDVSTAIRLPTYYGTYRLWPPRVDEEITVSCGRYNAKYRVTDAYSHNTFGLQNWKDANTYCKQTNIQFYEGPNLLFTRSSSMLPCLIIHCTDLIDQTPDNTYYSIRNVDLVEIYNMNGQIIRTTSVGPCKLVDLKRVNNRYAVSHTEETCTGDPFNGLIDLDIFFDPEQVSQQRCRPYDNSRTPVILSITCTILIACTETGFIAKDMAGRILTETVPYEKVWHDCGDDLI